MDLINRGDYTYNSCTSTQEQFECVLIKSINSLCCCRINIELRLSLQTYSTNHFYDCVVTYNTWCIKFHKVATDRISYTDIIHITVDVFESPSFSYWIHFKHQHQYLTTLNKNILKFFNISLSWARNFERQVIRKSTNNIIASIVIKNIRKINTVYWWSHYMTNIKQTVNYN